MPAREHYLFVCQNVRPDDAGRPSCGKSGAAEIYAALKAELNRRGLAKTMARACTSSCLDMCDEGPVVLLEPGNCLFRRMTVDRVPDVVQTLLDTERAEESVSSQDTLAGPFGDR